MEIHEDFHIPCPECGGTEYKLPEPLEDDSFVKCTQCGFETILADFREHGLHKGKERLTELAKQQVNKELKKKLRKYFK